MRHMKALIVVAFAAILLSLGSALVFMMRGDRSGQGRRGNMAKALAIRVGLSIVLFAGLLLAWKLGYIQPTGIPPGH